MSNPDPEMLSFFFKLKGSKFNKCLAPKEPCEGKAIRAHTVQNSRALDLLVSEDNHVVGIEVTFSANKNPEFIYKKISRHKATTFTGLCSKHDASLFKAIDTQEIEVSNQEHCFLLAYRSVMRELHATMGVAEKYQQTYYKMEGPDKFPNRPIGRAGIEATQNLINSYETYQYKIKYDFIHEYKEYDYINHHPIILEDQKPSIAVSSMFSVDDMKNSENDTLRIVINVLPLSDSQTLVLFSWLSHEEEAAKVKLNHIFLAAGYYQKYEISKLVLRYCENFVISTEYYLSWTEKKREIVKEYFEKNLSEKWQLDDPNIILFS